MSKESTELQISEPIQAALEKRGIEEPLWLAVRTSIFPGATEESCLMAVDYCKARSLDIMKKPCHIVPMNVKDAKSGKYGWRDVIMPGIAESRITASRTGQYAGQDAPVFADFVTFTLNGKKHEVPEWCMVTVYRMIDGQRVGFSHTEFFDEACGTTKNGDLNSMWTKRKRGQLAKCAEAGALRKAFPEETGGMSTAEEYIDIEANEVTERPTQRTLVRKTAVNPFNKKPTTEGGKTEQSEGQEKQPQAEKPQGDPPPANQPNGTTGQLSDVEVKTGEKKDGSPWKAWVAEIFVEGEPMKAGTFSQSIGEKAKSLVGQDVVFRVEYKNGHNQLNSIEAAEEGGLV